MSISLTAAFDAYLYLIGPNGAIVAFNDDSGATLNSRIPAGTGSLFTLPSNGTYKIEATSFQPNETGSYALSLSGVPLVLAEQSNGTVAAILDSVTFVRGPFRIQTRITSVPIKRRGWFYSRPTSD